MLAPGPSLTHALRPSWPQRLALSQRPPASNGWCSPSSFFALDVRWTTELLQEKAPARVALAASDSFDPIHNRLTGLLLWYGACCIVASMSAQRVTQMFTRVRQDGFTLHSPTASEQIHYSCWPPPCGNVSGWAGVSGLPSGCSSICIFTPKNCLNNSSMKDKVDRSS